MLVQVGNLAHASFPPWWNDVFLDALLLVQEGKVAHDSFPHIELCCLR